MASDSASPCVRRRHAGRPAWRAPRPAVVALAALALAACASLPTQEVNEARRALQAAESADGSAALLTHLAAVRGLIERAERALGAGNHESARNDAVQAKRDALLLRELAIALAAAGDEAARRVPGTVAAVEARALLTAATEAAERGELLEALRLARSLGGAGG